MCAHVAANTLCRQPEKKSLVSRQMVLHSARFHTQMLLRLWVMSHRFMLELILPCSAVQRPSSREFVLADQGLSAYFHAVGLHNHQHGLGMVLAIVPTWISVTVCEVIQQTQRRVFLVKKTLTQDFYHKRTLNSTS